MGKRTATNSTESLHDYMLQLPTTNFMFSKVQYVRAKEILSNESDRQWNLQSVVQPKTINTGNLQSGYDLMCCWNPKLSEVCIFGVDENKSASSWRMILYRTVIQDISLADRIHKEFLVHEKVSETLRL